ARMASALAAAIPGVEVRLVVGRWGARDVPAGVTAVEQPEGLADEMARAGVVVSAGGVAVLESCLLGRPTVGVVLAANQRQAVDGLARAGAITSAPPHEVANAVQALIDAPERRIALAAAAQEQIDGRGESRVADVIEELST